jgi:8-oxo-dGTP diphosphatase
MTINMIDQKTKKYRTHDLKRGIDFIGNSVVFYCHDGKGSLLLNKRSDKCRDEIGRWDPGGGALEFGEALEEAVEREVMEEYCTKPLEIVFIRSFSALRENNGVKTHWVASVFAVLVNPEEVKIGDPEKMDDIGWFSKESLPEPIHSQFWPFFPHVEKVIYK